MSNFHNLNATPKPEGGRQWGSLAATLPETNSLKPLKIGLPIPKGNSSEPSTDFQVRKPLVSVSGISSYWEKKNGELFIRNFETSKTFWYANLDENIP